MPNDDFVTIFLHITTSDTAVEKLFVEFGKAPDVIAGNFKKLYSDISNDKPHIRNTPYQTKHEFPMKYYLIILGLFRLCGLSGKNCLCVHMLQDTRHPCSFRWVTFNSTFREETAYAFLGKVFETWAPCSGPESTRNRDSSLMAIVERGAHNEPSQGNPNDECSYSDSPDDEGFDLDSGVCQEGQWKLVSKIKYVVHVS